MDFRILTAPLVVAGVLGVGVGVLTFVRPASLTKWQGRPIVWGGALALGLGLVASRTGLAPAQLLSSTSFTRLVGAVSLIAAAVALVLAIKARARAAVCFEARPLSVDDAVSAVRSGGKAEGVFEGRVTCEEPVTSPSGVVCVAYEAELREARVDGSRGSLVSSERGYSHVLQLAGERVNANVALHPAALMAKTEIRRCLVARTPSTVAPAEVLQTGSLPTEALSWERVLRMGARCRIVGKMEKNDSTAYRIKGVAGLPPLILVDEDVAQAGKRFSRAAWLSFVASSVLAVAGVLLLRGI